MDASLLRQAESLKEYYEEHAMTARDWVHTGCVLEDRGFEDANGHRPFQGCLERLTEKTREKADMGERWTDSDLASWCKSEADTWFDGFSDDSEANRRNFTASLYRKAKDHLSGL